MQFYLSHGFAFQLADSPTRSDKWSLCRCCLATRKGDLVRYGRKLLKDDTELWRDPEVISEVLGLAEDTEHRGDILLDIEAKFTETQVCGTCSTVCLQ